MCIPDAADRLWLSSETQINSNRAISPSLGISAHGRISLRSLVWLRARAVPGNGLAVPSGFCGACSAGVGRGNALWAGGESPAVPRRGCRLASSSVSWGGCKGGFATRRGRKPLPPHHVAVGALASLPAGTYPSLSTILGPRRPPCTAPCGCAPPGGEAVWRGQPRPSLVLRASSRVGKEWVVRAGLGLRTGASSVPAAAGVGCLSRGGGGKAQAGGWGRWHPLTLPLSLLAGAARALCT